MTDKQKHPDPQTVPPSEDASKVGHTDHGIPPATADDEPKGGPNSDRHQSETVPVKPPAQQP